MGTSDSRSTSFGDSPEHYDRSRPTYPAAAIDWALPAHAFDVADLGAGTGKLTAALVARGLHVTAIDPDDRMLQVLRRRIPAAHTIVANAEQLPLPEASFDAVLVADAWHWFNAEGAAKQIRRVLRAPGWLALLRHQPDRVSGWPEQIARLDPNFASRYDETRDHIRLPDIAVEEKSFHWTWERTPEQIRDSVATRSSFAGLSDSHRQQLLDHIERIAATAAERAHAPTLNWPHTTIVTRCHVLNS